MDCALCSVDAETMSQDIKFRGTVEEISILCQFLSWVSATFRLPEKEQLSCSSIHFVSSDEGPGPTTFCMILKGLYPLEDREPGTCWKVLFPSTVMVTGFRVPESPDTCGLQIPFDAMLEIANIIDEVELEDENGNPTGVRPLSHQVSRRPRHGSVACAAKAERAET